VNWVLGAGGWGLAGLNQSDKVGPVGQVGQVGEPREPEIRHREPWPAINRAIVGIVHETGIALSILESAHRVTGEARLESVKVAVGELSAIEPPLLEFAWKAVVADGPDREARLDIEWRPARQYCPRCEREQRREGGSWSVYCADCGEPLRVEGGYELDLLEITYTETGKNGEGSDPDD
jgi:Zn finger protein HypA/HybF involved in hydrogenase expression